MNTIIADIKTVGNIEGSVSVTNTLTCGVNLPIFATYKGQYNVVPKPHEEQILKTASKLMTKDVTVAEIPFYEVSNVTGKTVYIGKDVIINGD